MCSASRSNRGDYRVRNSHAGHHNPRSGYHGAGDSSSRGVWHQRYEPDAASLSPQGDFYSEPSEIKDYDQRVPLEIAENQIDNNMGDFMGANENVRSLASEGEFGLWNSLIIARGVGVGYEGVVSIDSPHFGNVNPDSVVRCEFDRQRANLRIGGFLPANDLGREIQRQLFWSNVSFNHQDVYGYCDDEGTPMVVVPLVSKEGYLFQNNRPWGVAYYNGLTGELKITQDVEEIAKLDGPTYPISVATAQRESFQSYDGDWWEHVQGKLGWDVVGNSEIQLRVAGTKESQYFTGLQPRGASAAVVAEFTVDARMTKPGDYNQVSIVMLDTPRASNGDIKDTIYTNYSSMTEFAGNKYDFYEIVPWVDGKWVASVGTERSVVYRLIVEDNGDKVTLIDRTGKTLNATVSNENGEETVTINGSIDGMSEAELLELLGQVTERLKELNK